MYLCTRQPYAVASLMITLALGITPAFAEEANGLLYSVPAGWSAADKDGARVVAPSNLAAGELMIAVMLGVLAPTGRPEDQIAQLAASANADVKVVSSSDVAITDRGSAGKLYIKNFEVASKDVGPHGRMVAVLARGEQRAAILFLITNAEVLQKYGAGMQALLTTVRIDPKAVAPPAAQPTAPASSAQGHLPIGETPDVYPGSARWLPSGRGVAIPVARVVKGRPEGMWWHFETQGSRVAAITTIFLADGTRATNPRPGSGTLFDLEGQRRTPGTTGVGTFRVSDGKITQAHDGFTDTHTFKSGSGNDGEWIEIGAGRHYPLSPATAKELVGTWKSQGMTYIFGPDGALPGGGTWQLDGYLLAIRNRDSSPYITTIGRTGKLLIIGTGSFSRE
jgi:hypothetical protein